MLQGEGHRAAISEKVQKMWPISLLPTQRQYERPFHSRWSVTNSASARRIHQHARREGRQQGGHPKEGTQFIATKLPRNSEQQAFYYSGDGNQARQEHWENWQCDRIDH